MYVQCLFRCALQLYNSYYYMHVYSYRAIGLCRRGATAYWNLRYTVAHAACERTSLRQDADGATFERVDVHNCSRPQRLAPRRLRCVWHLPMAPWSLPTSALWPAADVLSCFWHASMRRAGLACLWVWRSRHRLRHEPPVLRCQAEPGLSYASRGAGTRVRGC